MDSITFGIVLVLSFTGGSPAPQNISDYLLQGDGNDDYITSGEILTEDFGALPSKVPLVMRMLLEEAESNMPLLSQPSKDNNSQFKALAKSVTPTLLEQDGARRLLLEYPSLMQFDHQIANGEIWLVLSLNENYLQENECDQVVKVYQATRWDVNFLQSFPLKNYSLSFIEVNITDIAKRHRKNHLHFVVAIEDSTSYSSDDDDINLKNFSNYFFCSLPDASEIFVLDRTEQKPVLILISEEMAGRKPVTDIKRTKRDVIDIPQTHDEIIPENNENCRLVEWIITTAELGWEWLLYPERIPINLCIGACPSPLLDRRFNSTSHAVVRDFYRTLKGVKSESEFPAPCCVPRRYRPIAMLIETSMFTISLETSNDLSASKCGCR